MVTYAYRCAEDGAFVAHRAMGRALAWEPCPACGAASRRVYSPPLLPRLPRPLRAAMDGAERSRYEPDVVSALPAARRARRAPVPPAARRLRSREGPACPS